VLLRHPHVTETSFANHFFRNFPGFTCEYFESVYDNLYTRYGPFVVGVLLAGVGLCLALMSAPVYRPDAPLGRSFLLGYAVLHRNVWSIGVGAGLLACLYPRGPSSRAAARVLGARVFYPVAQLSYCTYLFHLGLVVASYGVVSKLLHPDVAPRQALASFALPELALTMALTVLTSFAFGALVYLLVERPFINLRS